MADRPEVYGETDNANQTDLPLRDRIESVYTAISNLTYEIDETEVLLKDLREEAILENNDAYMEAKNSDQREAVILNALAQDREYQNHRRAMEQFQRNLKLARIEAEKLRWLVEAAKAPGENY